MFQPFKRKQPTPTPEPSLLSRIDLLQQDYEAQGRVLVQLLNRVDALEEAQEAKRDKRGRFANKA